MKKALSLLLVLVMLLTLCACGNSNNQNTEPSDLSQNTTENTEESTQETTESTQATTEESTTASTEEPTTAPSDENNTKPADTSKPTHTHSYAAATCTQPEKCSCGATRGNALGHNWTEATCKTAKTCATCEATEGAAVGHVVEGTTCKWCKQVVPVSPINLKARTYTYTVSGWDAQMGRDITKFYDIDIANATYSIVNYCYFDSLSEEAQDSYLTEYPEYLRDYNGTKFVGIAGPAYSIVIKTENDHVVLVSDINETIELEVLSDDTLRVVSALGISVGTIFR